jgi:hypothetical protein
MHASGIVDRQNRDIEPFAFLKVLECVKHRMVLHATADKMSPTGTLAARQTEDSEVIRFGAAAGENQLVRFSP